MGAIRATAAAVLILLAAAVSAADCVSDSRVISTRSFSPNLVNGPAAWSGSTLAVAKTQEGATGALWVGVYNESLDPVAADRRIATDSRSPVALLWTGTEFGLFYRTLAQGMNLQLLTATGEPVGAPIPVTPDRTVYVADEIDIVWSPALNAYVVARAISQGRDEGLWVTILERDGTVRYDRESNVNPTQNSELEVAVSDSGVIGLFYITANGGFAFGRILPGQTAIEVRTLPLFQGATTIEATSHLGLFVVTRSLLIGTKTEIRWFIVDSSQQIVRPEATLVQPEGDDAFPLALISNGSELALAYLDVARRTQPNDGIYRLRRFTIEGTVISDTEFAAGSSSQARATTNFPFVWTGTSYISAPVRSAPDRLNSFLLRYCPLTAEILSPTRTNVRYGEPVTFSAVAGGGVPGYEYSWIFPNEIGPKRGQTLDRVFSRPGTYTVTLVVTDATGTSVTRSITFVAGKPKTRAARK